MGDIRVRTPDGRHTYITFEHNIENANPNHDFSLYVYNTLYVLEDLTNHRMSNVFYAGNGRQETNRIADNYNFRMLVDLSDKIGAVEITGSARSDIFQTGRGNDHLRGGAGSDFLIAGGGNDAISTGSGNDTVDAGTGSDYVYAAFEGHKTFRESEAHFGHDRFAGVNLRNDTFAVSTDFATDRSHLHFESIQGGDATLIYGDHGKNADTITLLGVDAATAKADAHFTFTAKP